jgi:hypothetical protein
MRRFASNTVFFGFSATWFFAASPTSLRAHGKVLQLLEDDRHRPQLRVR